MIINDIDAAAEGLTNKNRKVKGQELNPEELGREYTGGRGGLLYPGVIWEVGHKPTSAAIKKIFEAEADDYGFTVIPPKPAPPKRSRRMR